jgi:hypothetical protein
MAELPRPAGDLLAWAGTDIERVHEALMAELAGHRRENVLAELRNRLPWPHPDTRPARSWPRAARPVSRRWRFSASNRPARRAGSAPS